MENPEQQLPEGQMQTEVDRQELVQEETALAEEAEAIQLAEQQELYKNSQATVSNIPQPSYFIDGIQTTIGFINDGIDALELTGILAIFSLFISYFLSGLNILICLLSGNPIKHTNRGSKLKQRQIIKLVVAGGFEMIPGWSLGPWSILFNIWSCINKVQAYKDARKEAAEEVVSNEATEMV